MSLSVVLATLLSMTLLSVKRHLIPNQKNYQELDSECVPASEQNDNEANDCLSTRTPISFAHQFVYCEPIFLASTVRKDEAIKRVNEFSTAAAARTNVQISYDDDVNFDLFDTSSTHDHVLISL